MVYIFLMNIPILGNCNPSPKAVHINLFSLFFIDILAMLKYHFIVTIAYIFILFLFYRYFSHVEISLYYHYYIYIFIYLLLLFFFFILYLHESVLWVIIRSTPSYAFGHMRTEKDAQSDLGLHCPLTKYIDV